MKLPLKYQVLEALTNACNKYGFLELSVEKVIEENFPNIPESEWRSVFAQLRNEKLLFYGLADGKDIYDFSVAKDARSFLIEYKEELERKDAEKRDARTWQMKCTVIGYGLGFLSGVGLMLVKEYFFNP